MLIAVESATYHGDAILDDRNRRGTILGVASAYLAQKSEDVIIGEKRADLVRRIADRFRPEPADAQLRAKDVVLHQLDGFGLERVLGPPQASWWVHVVEECEAVQRRADSNRRLPIDYPMA